jgi:hypothetical protein
VPWRVYNIERGNAARDQEKRRKEDQHPIQGETEDVYAFERCVRRLVKGRWGGHTFSVCEVMAAPLDRGMMFEVMKLDERIVQRRPWRCLVMCGKHTGHALVSVGTSVGARLRWTRGSRALRQPRSGRPSEWPRSRVNQCEPASSGFQIVLGRLLADPTRMPLPHCTRCNTRPVAHLG